MILELSWNSVLKNPVIDLLLVVYRCCFVGERPASLPLDDGAINQNFDHYTCKCKVFRYLFFEKARSLIENGLFCAGTLLEP